MNLDLSKKIVSYTPVKSNSSLAGKWGPLIESMYGSYPKMGMSFQPAMNVSLPEGFVSRAAKDFHEKCSSSHKHASVENLTWPMANPLNFWGFHI